jgi:hypothetical protein
MNITKMRKLKKWILAEPGRYDQRWWIYGKGSCVVMTQRPPCGTAGCLGGNACLMEGLVPKPVYKGEDRIDSVTDGLNTFDVSLKAQEILGLTDKQQHDLFAANCDGWSGEARHAYLGATNPQEKANAAAMELDRLIKIELNSRKSRSKSKSKR